MKLFYRVVIVVSILAISGVAYYLWNASQESPQAFFETGKKYYDEGKYSDAAIQLQNALQKDPRHRQARYLLAHSYLSDQDWINAVRQLQLLLEYFPDDTEANLELGSLYLAGGPANKDMFRQARESAKKILAKDPENVRALILMGNATAGLQDLGESVKALQKALSLDPENVAASLSLGASRTLEKNYPEAEKAFLRARDLDSRNKSALMSLANYYRFTGKLQEAQVVFQEALALFPTDKAIYLQVVQFFHQIGRSDEAERVLREVQGKVTGNPEPSLVLAELYLSQNRSAEAHKLLAELKERLPGNILLAKKWAQILIKTEPDRAAKEINQIIQANPQDPEGHILLGELQFFSGKYDAAERTFKADLVSKFPQPHFFLGNIAAQRGQKELAQSEYQKALTASKEYIPARLALAEVFIEKDRLSDAREELRRVLELQPDSAPARLLSAMVDTVEKNYPQAERELSALMKEYPENAQVRHKMGFYYQERGLTKEAEKHYLKAIELQPDSPGILHDLTQFYLKQKQFEPAIQVISSVPNTRKQAHHYDLMGQVYLQAGKYGEAEEALQEAIRREPGRISARLFLARVYLQSGRMGEGLREVEELVRKNPNDAEVHGLKGYVFEIQGKLDEAKQSYSQALKIDPSLATAANNLAYILAEQGEALDIALRWAQLARKRDPENPSCADTLGWVYYKMGNYLLARDQLRFAISKRPDSPVIQYHLALAYWKNNQLEEAERALVQALKSTRVFKERTLADAALNEIGKQKNKG